MKNDQIKLKIMDKINGVATLEKKFLAQPLRGKTNNLVISSPDNNLFFNNKYDNNNNNNNCSISRSGNYFKLEANQRKDLLSNNGFSN
jgi:hypothetical protein